MVSRATPKRTAARFNALRSRESFTDTAGVQMADRLRRHDDASVRDSIALISDAISFRSSRG